MEFIVSAAIQWRLNKEDATRYVTGPNHAYCIQCFKSMGLKAKNRDWAFEKIGFMTSNSRFVDRVEAFFIALEANQLKEGVKSEDPVLFSEDLAWLGEITELE